MSSLSANFRRAISRKRNALKDLFPASGAVIDKDLTTLSRDELVKLSNQATRLKAELSSTLAVVTENGKKWQTLIDDISDDDDENTRESAEKELADYFEDSTSHPYRSVESIHDEVTTRSAILDSVVQNTERILNRMSLNPQASVAPIQPVPMPNAVVTPSVSVPLPTLPTLTLQTFDGKGCWETYWKGFSEIIDERSEIGDSTKLRYLQSSLIGEASDLFAHLLKRGCEYKEVVSGLQNEYKSTVKSHLHLLKEFGALRPKNDTAEEQLRAIRSFETLITQLKALHADPDNNPYCLHSVLERFSPYCQKIVHLKMREESSSLFLSLSDALSTLKTKLKEDIELRELCPSKPKQTEFPVNVLSAQTGDRRNPSGRTEKREKGGNRPLKYPAHLGAGTAQPCIFCNTHPNSFMCDKMNAADKRTLLGKQYRCYVCFQKGHISENCTMARCESCSPRYHIYHHPSVCTRAFRSDHPSRTTKSFIPRAAYAPKPFVPRSTENSSTRTARVPHAPVNTATSSDRIRMLTSGISISNPHSGYTSRVDVLLDCGAGLSLISEQTREQLSLPTVRRETLDLIGLAGVSRGVCEYDVVEIALPTLDGSMTIEAIVLNDPITGSIPMATLTHDDKLAINESGIRLADNVHRKGRVYPRLLIGGKDFYRVTGLADHRLPSGLFVVKTLLGAMIAGEKETDSMSPRECPLIPIMTLTDGSQEQEQEQMLLSKENDDQGPTDVTKILGVGNDPPRDEWVLKCDTYSPKEKCSISQIMSKLADANQPVGHLIPLLLQSKLFVQKLWLTDYEWDDSPHYSDFAEWIRRVKSIGLCNALGVSRFSFHCVPIHMFLHWARGRTATHRHKPWVALTVNETLAGQLRVELKDASFQCDEDNDGYHIDIYVHAKRCPQQVSCKGEKYGNVSSSSLVGELAADKTFPGHTCCAESYGTVGCDCFCPSFGCLLYHASCEPRSENIYRTSNCPTRIPSISIKCTLTIGNEATFEMFSLRPNEWMKISRVPYQKSLANVENFTCTNGEGAAHWECKQPSLVKDYGLDKVSHLVISQLRVSETSFTQSITRNGTQINWTDSNRIGGVFLSSLICIAIVGICVFHTMPSSPLSFPTAWIGSYKPP